MTGIPVLEFAHATHPAHRAAFVAQLGESLETFGFVAISGHGIETETLGEAYRTLTETFALPRDTKQQYEVPEIGRQRGYTSFGVEHAKNQDAADLKEFWHVGRDLAEGHPLGNEIPRNQFPAEISRFEPVFSDLFARMEHFANLLLDAIADYLELEEGYFRTRVHDGNSVLRLIHYPPLGDDPPDGAIRAAAHEDINLITVLPVSTQPGLQLLTRDGQWMEVHPPPGVMLCDTGDMMSLLTGGRLPATTHRVVNPESGRHSSRYSMPFFVHPHPDTVLAPLDGSAPGVTARDFLHQRLVEIGVA